MRRKNRKQKKVKVAAGKEKSGFEAEDEEEDVICRTFISLIYSCFTFISNIDIESNICKIWL